MANAPPTPPATTDVELNDEARMPVSSPPVADNLPPLQTEPTVRPEAYREFLPVIGELIANKNIEDLVRVTEIADIQVQNDHSPSRLLTVTPLVFGFLIKDDTAAARYAITRLPENVVSFGPCRALMTLAVATAHRQYSKVYGHIEMLLNQASSAEFPDKELGAIITTMAPIFLESFRNRALALICKAYTTLPVGLASVYLGISEEELKTDAGKLGWSLDPTTQVLHSTNRKPVPTISWSPPKSSLRTFSTIAESVVKLEA